jgi:hypothetical protein
MNDPCWNAACPSVLRRFHVHEEFLQKDEEVCDDDYRYIPSHIKDWVIAPSRYRLIPGPCYR